MENIFSGVSRNNEDATTELLANLMGVKYIRDLILAELTVDKDIIQRIKKDDIDTQVNYSEDGKPDIVIENDETLIFIENKIRIGTELQLTQITSYVERLRSSKKQYKKMIYLVPEGYSHLNELLSVVQSGNDCSVTYWETLLTALYANDLHAWSELVSQSLGHLSDLILRKEISTILSREEVVIMFNPQDLIAANGLLNKMRNFIPRVVESLVNLLGKDFNFADIIDKEEEIGQYVRYKNESWAIFLGLNFWPISEHPDKAEYLFSIAMRCDIVDSMKAEKHQPFKNDDWFFFKLDKYASSDLDNPAALATEISNIIKSVII
jgi:hypothetical protein